MVQVAGGQLPPSSPFAGSIVNSFQCSIYEITYGEWREVASWALSQGYDFGNSDISYMGNWDASLIPNNYPVVGVSWDDCAKWCNAKSEKEGLTLFYIVNNNIFKSGEYPFEPSKVKTNSSANGYRLPSEMEWEWAARGGISSKGYVWSGSNTASEVGWFYSNSSGSNVFKDPQGPYGTRGTMPVGLKKANELGLYDMSGNADEWCGDTLYNNNRICRGGSWKDTTSSPVAYRNQYGLWGSFREKSIGFRVIRNN